MHMMVPFMYHLCNTKKIQQKTLVNSFQLEATDVWYILVYGMISSFVRNLHYHFTVNILISYHPFFRFKSSLNIECFHRDHSHVVQSSSFSIIQIYIEENVYR